MADRTPGPIRISIALDDPLLSDRLARLLAEVPGLLLVGTEESADMRIIASGQSHSAVQPNEKGLTQREQAVLALMVEGASNKLIARRLGISVHTAKFHVRRITDKLDAVGRTDAVAHALQMKIISI
jgi:DNA-binding CsgD family transcriptional regulator